MRTHVRRTIPIAVFMTIVTIIIVYAAGAWEWVSQRYASFELARVFTDDGSYQVSRLQVMIEGLPLTYGFYNYGHAHHLLAWVIGKPLELLGVPIDFLSAARLLQSIQVGAWIGILGLFFSLGLYYTRQWLFALGVSLLLVTTPALYFWGYEVHPDTVQVFFIVLSLYFALRATNQRSHFLAAVTLGFAIGTKYSAVIYLPFLALLAVADALRLGDLGNVSAKTSSVYDTGQGDTPTRANKALERQGAIRSGLTQVLAVGGFSILGYVLTNYPAILQPVQLVSDVRFERARVAYGHGAQATRDWTLWLHIWNEQTHGLILPIAILTATTLVFMRLRPSQRSDACRRTALVLTGASMTLAIGLLQLGTMVNERQPRYFLPLVPLVYVMLLVSASYWRRRVPLSASRIAGASAGTLLIGTGVFALVSAMKTQTIGIERVNRSLTVAAGEVVTSGCNDRARVLLPIYSYLPEGISISASGYTFTSEDIAKSDVLLLNSSVPGRHIWPGPNGTLIKGSYDDSESQFDLFSLVLTSPEWVRVIENEEVLVVYRANSGVCQF